MTCSHAAFSIAPTASRLVGLRIRVWTSAVRRGVRAAWRASAAVGDVCAAIDIRWISSSVAPELPTDPTSAGAPIALVLGALTAALLAAREGAARAAAAATAVVALNALSDTLR